MNNGGPEKAIELFHGYTYSAHPIACAAALATLEAYKEDGLFERAARLAPYFEDALHSLKGEPNVSDIRNIGLMGAVERAYPQQGLRVTCQHHVLIRLIGSANALARGQDGVLDNDVAPPHVPA